jgi:hypothetical protein
VFCSAQSDSGTSSPGEYSGGLVMAAVNQLGGPQAPALRRFHGLVTAREFPRIGQRRRRAVPKMLRTICDVAVRATWRKVVDPTISSSNPRSSRRGRWAVFRA